MSLVTVSCLESLCPASNINLETTAEAHQQQNPLAIRQEPQGQTKFTYKLA